MLSGFLLYGSRAQPHSDHDCPRPRVASQWPVDKFCQRLCLLHHARPAHLPLLLLCSSQACWAQPGP